MVESTEIKNIMEDLIRETSLIMELNKTTVRVLLNSFKWDKQNLIEQFFDIGVGGLLEKASLPNNEYMGRPRNLEGFENLSSPQIKDKARDPFENVTQQKSECSICCDEYIQDDLKGLGCQHYFCVNCWKGYLSVEITTKFVCTAIQCPQVNCSLIVDDHVINDIIKDNRTLLRAYEKSTVRSFVENNPRMRWCPNSCCDFVAVLNNNVSTDNPLMMTCSHCDEIFCFCCGNIWHEPVGCREFKKWIDLISNDVVTLKWIGCYTKPCPKCQEGIEKDGGCNHMSCLKCSHQFCWMCLKPWSSHETSSYSCNKPEKEVFDVEMNRNHLNYFKFYYERYENHEKSMRLEEKLRTTMRFKLSQIKARSEIFIDEHLIDSSIDVLCVARRYLQFSYAFAYFLKQNNYFAIFLTNQAELERATEFLSRLLEDKEPPTNFVDFKKNLQISKSILHQRLHTIQEFIHDCCAKYLLEFVD